MSEGVLAGKVAIVTGASRGIGRAVAERFASQGAKVVINYRSSEGEARDVASRIESNGGEATPLRADVSSSSEVKHLVAATVDRFGTVDILVNNAGIMISKAALDATEEDWDRTIDINLKGAYL